MEVARGPAHVRRREALARPVNPDLVPTERAPLGHLEAGHSAAESAQEGAMLADCIHRTVAHDLWISGLVAG
jgi:hypothetical protein